MKRRIKQLYFLLLLPFMLLVNVNDATAQTYLKLAYKTAFPVENTQDFVDKPSFRGGGIEIGRYVSSKVSLGFKADWQVFYDNIEAEEYTTDNVTLFGEQFRYINSIPLLATIKYNHRKDGEERQMIIPYGGLNFGPYYFHQELDMGVYSLTSEDDWHFGVQPEVGVQFDVLEAANLDLNVTYNHLFETANTDAHGYFNVSVGVVFFPK